MTFEIAKSIGDATSAVRRAPLAAWVPTLAVVSVPAIVIPAILVARIAYHFRHPEALAEDYLTISRAISDPVIGEPFAVAVTIAAVLLWGVFHYVLRMAILQRPPLTGWRVWAARIALVGGSIAITGSCIGMVVLSHYRLDDGDADRDLHMFGSYLFFVSQSAAIFFLALFHRVVAAARTAGATRLFFSDLWRARIGFTLVAAAVAYGLLFAVKAMDFGAATPWVVWVYVELETALITSFLLYFLFFAVDVFAFAGRPR